MNVDLHHFAVRNGNCASVIDSQWKGAMPVNTQAIIRNRQMKKPSIHITPEPLVAHEMNANIARRHRQTSAIQSTIC